MSDDGTVVRILAQGVAAATPYLLAGLGEAFAQRSGIYNLGVDGIMLMGAFTAFYTAFTTHDLGLAVLVAALVGAAMGLLMAFVSVTLRSEQGISGIGLYMFGLGLSTLLFDSLVKTPTPLQESFKALPIPLLSDLPVIGPILFRHNLMVYGALILTPIAWFVINKTTFGLNIRAVGQNPQAADSLGVNVSVIRYLTVTCGGLMAGIAGASLSTALYPVFQPNMTNGIGFIAVALVYFGGWSPYGILFGSLLFSIVTTAQLWLQAFGVQISPSLANMLPYVVTIIVLILGAYLYRTQAPAALGRPYHRDET
jgi:general nucleoside transport system permease protein